jgi:hypothetical protein
MREDAMKNGGSSDLDAAASSERQHPRQRRRSLWALFAGFVVVVAVDVES